MGGDAVFSGANYQASVIAYVFVHVITDTQLRWLPIADDTPSAVSGEVNGPGDDARVEFVSGHPPIEIQAKHGLRPSKAIEAFRAIRDASTTDQTTTVLLTVDSTSSLSIRRDLRRDLDRLRSGRSDALKDIASDLLTEFGEDAFPTLQRVHVRQVDVQYVTDSEAAKVLGLLADNLEDPSRATTAWALMEKDAATMCADKSRRTRSAIVELLSAERIVLRPPRRTRKWHDDLRHTKTLLAEDEPEVALALLKQIELDLKTGAPDSTLLYRLNQLKAAAYLQIGTYNEARRYALTALDHDPNGVHALVTLSNAQALDNQVEDALRTAEQATSRHPQSPFAWLMRLQLSLVPGQAAIVTPPDVASTNDYRRGLVRVYVFHGDGAKAREVSASLIQDGDRAAATLLLRVEALFVDLDTAEAEDRRARALEAQRLCSEVLDESSAPSERLSQRALVARSVAHRLLGNIQGADADIENARALRPDDANVLGQAVQTRIQAGREDTALELLTAPIVETEPFLLVLRARLRAGRGEVELARRDLDAVRQALPSIRHPDVLRSGAAEVALALSDLSLAKQLINETSPSFRSAPHYAVVLARIAALEGDLPRAETEYRKAATIDPAHRSDLLAELGLRFLVAKHPAAAVRVFREAQPLPTSAESAFVRALIDSRELGDAQSILEQVAARGHMPNWAVAYAAQIALRRNDPVHAATYLEELVQRGAATADGRLTLIEALLDLDQPDRARQHARALQPESDLSPRERMALAQFLLRLGEPAPTAIALGVLSFRQDPDDPDINRAFTSLVLKSRSAPIEVDRVGPDTHVTLRLEGSDKTLDYLVFAETLTRRLPNEMTLKDAQAAGLVGLRVGETFAQDRGAWFEKRWRIETIEPATKYLFNDVIANFGTRFPNERFFATGFQVNPDVPRLSDLQPLIESTRQRGEQQEKLLNLYRDQGLPLSVVAKLAGVTVPDLIRELSKPDGERPVYVEWADVEANVASRAAAREAPALVVCRASLFTAHALGISDVIRSGRRCVAPRSLRDELRAELAEAEARVKDGWNTIAANERGLIFQKLEPGDPILVRERDAARALLAWVDAHLEILPRPLEAFSDPRTANTDMRADLGESANDCLELALHLPAVFYADDLWLRAIGKAFGILSCSTVSLIQVMAESGDIRPEERDRMLVDLVERHYNAVPVSPELLVESLTPGRTIHATRETFSLLAAPAMQLATAARVLVKGIKAAALKEVRTATTEQMTLYGLEGMGHRFAPLAATQAVSQAAEDALALLPTELRALKAACVRFRRERG